MTMQEMALLALSLLSESEEDLNTYDAGVIMREYNILLGECFDINNSIREAAGQAPLIEVPHITAMGDTLTYEEKLLRTALPYGLASAIVFDDDVGKRQIFRNEYIAACNQFQKVIPTVIGDVY